MPRRDHAIGRRPTPALDTGWQADAACRDTPWDLWFGPPDEFEGPEARAARENVALAYCGRCPVRTDCLDHAIATRSDDGIAGGMTADERRTLRRRYGRKTA